ncbi:MAG: nucleotide exchange factor GrpE [Clostridia bacterium]|nr:nucleotide exchange factor GrpE [Clostridia bacterium]
MEKKKDAKHGEAEKEKEEGAQEAEEASENKELSELEKAQALAEDYKRKWYSVSAEYDNYRKRNAAAISKAYADGTAEAILKLLPVADNFGYALDSASDEKTKAGIDKVIKSFKTILSSLGVEEIEIAAGAPFNEDEMEAVMNFPCEEGETPNTVKQVLKKGYRQGEKVIRFAQVTVISE